MISLTAIKNIFLFIAGFVLALFLFRGCHSCPVEKIVVRDTVKIPIPIDSSAWYNPDDILQGGNIERANQIDSFIQYEKFPVDSEAVAAAYYDYHQHRDYSNIYHLKAGDVQVDTKVSKNKIDSQRVVLRNFS